MPVQTTRISARSPAIENQTQNFHLASDVTHSWFGFPRCRPWDKCSTANHLFQRWSQETPLEEWGWDKNRKEASKECLTSCFYCGESEFYPIGETQEEYKVHPQVYPPKQARKLGHLSTNSLFDIAWGLLPRTTCSASESLIVWAKWVFIVREKTLKTKSLQH